MRPALVHAHFAAADDAVHMGFGHALELANQEVVEPLAGVVLIDGDQRCLRKSHRDRFGIVGRWRGMNLGLGRCKNGADRRFCRAFCFA